MTISVICVYNRENDLQNQLLESLEIQDIPFEFVAIDNTQGKFTSAAMALNYGAHKANGEVLIFAHQDIYFKTSTALKELAEQISRCKIGDIIGTVGVKEKSKVYFSNLTEGTILSANLLNDFSDKIIEVTSVDECLFGMLRPTWEQEKFDEGMCDNWHLYSVEMCLRTRKNGFKVYVCPIQIHHFSCGNISIDYMRGLIKLADHYRKDFKYIWTTCYKIHSSWIYVRVLYFLWVVNRKIRKCPLE